MLARIIEPHKGKIVLFDVWGTWCAPCRQAMKDAQELYKRLKDYDVVYVYLANGSPESGWRSLIEEYNVKGDNVFHYNLPVSQQSEIELFLKVTGFPSYRVVDRQGNLLDVNADPVHRALSKNTQKSVIVLFATVETDENGVVDPERGTADKEGDKCGDSECLRGTVANHQG